MYNINNIIYNVFMICVRSVTGMKEMDTIITIGRQFGSGGREIGNLLAEDLHVKLLAV